MKILSERILSLGFRCPVAKAVSLRHHHPDLIAGWQCFAKYLSPRVLIDEYLPPRSDLDRTGAPPIAVLVLRLRAISHSRENMRGRCSMLTSATAAISFRQRATARKVA
jgi:hypothetical protein